MTKKITKAELKARVQATGSHFFDRETMRAWGDTMANFSLGTATVSTYSCEEIECWELSQKRAVRRGSPSVYYFAKDDYRRVFPASETAAK